MFTRILSEKIFQKALQVLPGGVSSPVRALKETQCMPLIAKRGKGSYLFDVDGNSYLDYCMNFGASILGHAPDPVIEALHEEIENGLSFGVTVELEEKLASLIRSALSSMEKIRFVSSGTEATMTAIRLARGFTGRSKILKFSGHYHGHVDGLLVGAGSGALHLNLVATSKGIPESILQTTHLLPFNDRHALEQFFSQNKNREELAAVILEPIAANMGVVPPEPEFLQFLRDQTKEVGALLIFDEVVTGFRVSWQGAQGLYHIEPDLTCLGKIISGALPAAAVGGKKEILDQLAPLGEVYQAGTLAGNPLAMRAGFETLSILQNPSFYPKLEALSEKFQKALLDLFREKGVEATVQGVGSMFSLFFGVEEVKRKREVDQEKFFQLFRFLFERGIYIPPGPFESWFISQAHTEEDLSRTLEGIRAFLN